MKAGCLRFIAVAWFAYWPFDDSRVVEDRRNLTLPPIQKCMTGVKLKINRLWQA